MTHRCQKRQMTSNSNCPTVSCTCSATNHQQITPQLLFMLPTMRQQIQGCNQSPPSGITDTVTSTTHLLLHFSCFLLSPTTEMTSRSYYRDHQAP